MFDVPKVAMHFLPSVEVETVDEGDSIAYFAPKGNFFEHVTGTTRTDFVRQ